MRKISTAVLAVPVLAIIYLIALWHRPRAGRVVIAAGIGIVALAGVVVLLPKATSATPGTAANALSATQFGPDVAAVSTLDGAVELDFSQPMDVASVESLVQVAPATPVRFTWLQAGLKLRIAPESPWTPSTYFTVTVPAGVKTATGSALAAPVIKGFYTRTATTAVFAPSAMRTDGYVGLRTSFVVTFDGAVQPDTAKAAFQISPTVAGAVTVTSNPDGTSRLTFKPSVALAANTAYTVSFSGSVLDADGSPVADTPALTVTTTQATPAVTVKTTTTVKKPTPTPAPAASPKPTVKPAAKPTTKPSPRPPAPLIVRTRPAAGAANVDRMSTISVRFSRAMDRAATQNATVVTIAGRQVTGSFSWVENDTVLVFDPTSSMPAGARVSITVRAAARSAAGGLLAQAMTATFTTAAAGKPKPPPPPSGGGGSGGGAWAAVEHYYLGLMNCTRGGGWVQNNGSCAHPGTRHVTPLWIDSGISSKVSRPYAKLLASTGVCDHFYRGNPGNRLSAAGYNSYIWAENLGCRSAPNGFASVLGTHIYFQSERPYNGGHWVNMMNLAYDRVGLGVWMSHGNVRLVIDFYHPR